MANMENVVAKLSQLSEKGQVPWKSTSDKSAFAATFGNMSVLLSSNEHFRLNSRTLYKLAVLDNKGDEIDSTTDDYEKPLIAPLIGVNDPPPLARLYTLAKRTALGVDDRLEELIRAMDAGSGD